MSIAQRTIGDLVAEDYLRASVFKQYGIDFCCGGKRTLAAACAKQEVSLDEIEQALQSTGRNGTGLARRPGSWAPDFLADYIENEHHSYVRESIPVLRAFTQKVARVHGGSRTELVEIAERFEELASELLRHTEEEEEVLFPYIRALVAAAEGEPAPEQAAAFETVREPIQSMEDDHERAGEIMRQIRALVTDSRRQRAPATPTGPPLRSSRSSRRICTATCIWRTTSSSRKPQPWSRNAGGGEGAVLAQKRFLPVPIATMDRQALVDKLSEDLACEDLAVLMYATYATPWSLPTASS